MSILIEPFFLIIIGFPSKSLHLIDRFQTFFVVFFASNLAILCVVVHVGKEVNSRLLPLYNLLSDIGHQRDWIKTVDSLMLCYFAQGTLYTYVLYIYVYAQLYQIMDNMSQEFDLTKPYFIKKTHFEHFWKQRLEYIEVRKEAQQLFGTIALLYFVILFISSVFNILFFVLVNANLNNVLFLLIPYVSAFAIPALLSAFLIGNYVDFDECFNRNLYQYLNENASLLSNYDRLSFLDQERRQAYLNHLRLYMRVPVTAFKFFEIDQKLPLNLCSTAISFAVIVYNILAP